MGLVAAINEVVMAEIEARSIIKNALQDALETMQGMCVNEGQTAAYDSEIPVLFTDAAQARPEEGWTDVQSSNDDFMGEIVEEGNSIMADAYDQAQEVIEEAYTDAFIEATEELGPEGREQDLF